MAIFNKSFIQCDRCKAEKQIPPNQQYTAYTEAIKGWMTLSGEYLTAVHEQEFNTLLCPTCRKAVEDWLKQEGMNNFFETLKTRPNDDLDRCNDLPSVTEGLKATGDGPQLLDFGGQDRPSL
jgi:hypothetical protein